MGFLLGAGKKTQGASRPGYTGLQVQTSAYGITLSIIYGQARTVPNLIWYGDFKAIQRSSSAGGKGGVAGGGGKGGGGVTYSYRASVAFAISEGPITDIGPSMWNNGTRQNVKSIAATEFLGDYAQLPWGYLTSKHPGEDDNYRGVAYVGVDTLNLGDSPHLPQVAFEIRGFFCDAIPKLGDPIPPIATTTPVPPGPAPLPDADPAVVMADFITNVNYGAAPLLASRLGDAVTNLLKSSEAYDDAAAWVLTGATLIPNAVDGPSPGTNSGEKILEDGSTGAHGIAQSVTKTATAITYASTHFVRNAERTRVKAILSDAGGTNFAFADFDLATQAVVASGVGGAGFTFISASLAQVPGQPYFRITLIATSNTATTIKTDLQLMVGASASYAGTVGFGVYLGGSQLEAASSAGLYVKTTSSGPRTLYFATFSHYCRSLGLVISPVITEQKRAADYLQEWAELLNSEFVWSSGTLRIVPYGDEDSIAWGGFYTAPAAPQYDLTIDDFLPDDGDPPVKVIRKRPADSFNQLKLEFLNRANQYNPEPVEAKLQAEIDAYGLRSMDTRAAHIFCDAAACRMACQLMLQRQSVRNQYRFNVGWKYSLLDPMDIVTITDDNLGLVRQWVRILDIDEDDEGRLTMLVEEYLNGNASAPVYPSQRGSRYLSDFNADPGLINDPLLFEPSLKLTQGGNMEIWAAVSGIQDNWGGCEVWASSDGNSYSRMDRITSPARMGVLTQDIPSVPSSGIDEVNILKVDLSISKGELLSGTSQDAVSNNTLCYVDGELISYRDAALTATNKYDLSYLNRGAYESTIGTHLAGTDFARLDDSILKIAVGQDRISQPIYLKFLSFNVYGAAQQTLDDVPAYLYTVTGAALVEALPNPTNLNTNYIDNITIIRWTPISDIRSPIDYEIRSGLSFTNSLILGRTTEPNFPISGDGTYWVSARYVTSQGVSIYSASPPSIVIAGNATLVKNVIQTWNEQALDWLGTLEGGAAIGGIPPNRYVELGGAGDILAAPDVLVIPDILFYGGVVASGIYNAPAGSGPGTHRVTLAYVANCLVSMTWQAVGQSIYDNILAIDNILTQTDILGSQFNPFIDAIPQVRLSTDGGTNFGPWLNYSPGVYRFNAIEARMLLATSDLTITALLLQWTWSVDVPDRLDRQENVPCPDTGLAVVFTPAAFNVIPNVQITILNAAQGDDVFFLAGPTASGFTVQIQNGGVGVARTINWTAQGY